MNNRFRPLEDIIKYDGEIASPSEPNRFKRVSSQANNIDNFELGGSFNKNQTNSILKQQPKTSTAGYENNGNIANIHSNADSSHNNSNASIGLNPNNPFLKNIDPSLTFKAPSNESGSENNFCGSGKNNVFQGTSKITVKNISETSNTSQNPGLSKTRDTDSNNKKIPAEFNKPNTKMNNQNDNRERYFSEQQRTKEIIGNSSKGNNTPNEPEVETKSTNFIN